MALSAVLALGLTACASTDSVSGASASVSQAASAASRASTPITRAMVEQTQREWVAALVSIGAAHQNGTAAARAGEVLDRYYDFGGAGVVFKPTLTSGEQTFRLTREGALAYFVGGNPNFPGDSGFALTGYRSGEVSLAGFVSSGNVAVAVGNIEIVAPDGSRVKVDKTFGYRMADDGRLRIISHHSSLPFQP